MVASTLAVVDETPFEAVYEWSFALQRARAKVAYPSSGLDLGSYGWMVFAFRDTLGRSSSASVLPDRGWKPLESGIACKRVRRAARRSVRK